MRRVVRVAAGGTTMLLATVVVANMLAVSSVASATTVRSSTSLHSASCAAAPPSRHFLGVIYARGPSGATVPAVRPCASSSTLSPTVPSSGNAAYDGGSPPLVYKGGLVMGTVSTTGENTVHAIYWAPPLYSFPSGYASLINGFLTNVASDSGKPTNVYATDTQYYQVLSGITAHIHYKVNFGGAIPATDTFPATGGCAPDAGKGETYTACIDDVQLEAEVANVIAANRLPTGLGQLYMVFFPPQVETCDGTSNSGAFGTCSDTAYSTAYCAYHSGYGSGTSTVIYSNETYPTSNTYTCLTGQSPNNSPFADSAIDLVSHEQNESITDPTGNSWYDTTTPPGGFEIGDECDFIFGSPLGGISGSYYNQAIGTGDYYLQQEFSNEDYNLNSAKGCISAEEVPLAAFQVTTSAPVAGTSVSFDGTASSDPDVTSGIASYSWNFGDSSALGSGAAPSHTYSTANSYTATLTVTDVDGWTGSTSHTVTVASGSAPPPPPPSPPTTTPLPIQIYGQDAIGTSIAVSQAEFPTAGSAKGVVLARSDFFSDALAGGPLAAAVDGPLLITPGAPVRTSLDPRVEMEIERMLPAGGTVYILGGDLALSPNIDTTLEGLGYKVVREPGADEYATAVDIAEALGNPSTIFEATGLRFYDALSAVPAAIKEHAAILLTDGSTQAPETAAYLTQHLGDTRYAIGGPLAAYGADPTAIPVYGPDLFNTSAAVATQFFPSASIFGAATAVGFPDALGGGVFMATGGRMGPLLLVNQSTPLPPEITPYLNSLAVGTQGYVFGGPLAVGAAVLAALQAAVG